MAVESAADLAAFFQDDEFGAAATYNGDAVTVAMTRPDAQAGLFATGAIVPEIAALVRVSEVAQPAEGDTLVVGGETYTVRTFRRDETRSLWRLALEEA